MIVSCALNKRISSNARNFWIEDKTTVMMGPVVTSDRITARNGSRKVSGEMRAKSALSMGQTMVQCGECMQPCSFSRISLRREKLWSRGSWVCNGVRPLVQDG